MFRLLVVEDQEDFYADYMMRVFAEVVPMEKIQVEHAQDLTSACAALNNPWDMIFMDFSMGPAIDFFGDVVKDGGSLTQLRRGIEDSGKITRLTKDGKRAYIVGTASSGVGNGIMEQEGADEALLKIEVEAMAGLILERLEQYGQ